ncbi:hypothetical protein NUU61_001628 [Penicillium alfredii]|uniref:Rhodopsin domain-containing protein n=1 Tax=Penicillium alfredii TaxID=1506179 RepID=A0A9W9KFW1_9EURO|nr:uncharacterized protein NUU61_001628 [Penicillium alfredii]KAJ5104281.1 hypothetical protein NUU61_001628 [Penicillium alfredii]
MAGKVSIAALLIGVFGPTDLFWHKLFLWVFCVGIAVPVSTAYAIFGLVQCSPPAALWDNRIHGKCVDAQVVADYGAFTGAYCTFVDVCLALLPATIFLRLHIRPVQKWQLSIVFALNILTSICSAIKSYHLAKLPKSTDFTWASYDVYAWHTGESFAILFCGTIPILKPVLDFIRRQEIISSWREGWKSRSSKSTTQKTSSRSWSDHRVQIGTISSHELGKYRWDETDRESTRVLVGKYGDI